jgi:hypothetical protein
VGHFKKTSVRLAAFGGAEMQQIPRFLGPCERGVKCELRGIHQHRSRVAQSRLNDHATMLAGEYLRPSTLRPLGRRPIPLTCPARSRRDGSPATRGASAATRVATYNRLRSPDPRLALQDQLLPGGYRGVVASRLAAGRAGGGADRRRGLGRAPGLWASQAAVTREPRTIG